MAHLGVGFNGINALARHVVTALQPCGTLGAGFNGINVLATRVVRALQPCDKKMAHLELPLMVLMPLLAMF